MTDGGLVGRWWAYGADAVLIECPQPEQRWQIRCPTAREIVVGARTVLLRFDPRQHTAADVVGQITSTAWTVEAPREHLLRVIYDGTDLPLIAERTGLSRAEVVRRHTRPTYRAEFCGFAPGFAYLSGLDPLLVGPRRTTPRPRVPAGSVAVAGPYCAVYPGVSPGGWQLLGTTTAALFDATAAEPALIRPGDTVRFEAAGP